jgi:hypothetical protein
MNDRRPAHQNPQDSDSSLAQAKRTIAANSGRPRWICAIGWIAGFAVLSAGGAVAAVETTKPSALPSKWVLNRQGERAAPPAVIPDVCAWPNLTLLPNGDIAALIFNQPSHSRMPGDVECWASEDGGETWKKRSVAAPRGGPTQTRHHKAVGLTAAGDLILVTTGYSSAGDPDAWSHVGSILPPWICTSKDEGRTWQIDRENQFPRAHDGRILIPWGDISPGADGKLRVPLYSPGYVPERDGNLPPAAEGDELAQLARERIQLGGAGRRQDLGLPDAPFPGTAQRD